MDKNMLKMNQAITPDNRIDEDFFIEKLEKIADKSTSSSQEFTYYFEDRDTNPLKNVNTSVIAPLDFTTYHKHDFYEINFVTDGVLYEHIGGKNIILKGGEMLFMAPGVYHTCCPSENTHCYNICFRKSWLARVSEGYAKYDAGNYLSSLTEKEKTYSVFSFGDASEEVSSLALKVIQMSRILVHHVDLYENLSMENVAAEFLLTLTKYPRHEYNFISDKKTRVNNYTPDDIIRYINDNFDKITLPDTALRFGYSQSQLHRIIKRSTGVSFSEVILSVRMQRARHYLLNTHLPIKSIAYLLGLDSAEHFSRMFKKNRGMTPKEYRNTYMRLSLRNKDKQK